MLWWLLRSNGTSILTIAASQRSIPTSIFLPPVICLRLLTPPSKGLLITAAQAAQDLVSGEKCAPSGRTVFPRVSGPLPSAPGDLDHQQQQHCISSPTRNACEAGNELRPLACHKFTSTRRAKVRPALVCRGLGFDGWYPNAALCHINYNNYQRRISSYRAPPQGEGESRVRKQATANISPGNHLSSPNTPPTH